MPKSILISISPNTDKTDVLLAFKTLLKPSTWLNSQTNQALSQRLLALVDQSHCFLYNSGRSALLAGLQSLSLSSDDEVLCQAFTCVAVPNAIIWSGAKPIFVDTPKNSFNLSIKDLKKKITSRTKALIIQHTFGIPDNLEQIKKICRQHHLILIEDCAHSLGANYQNKPVGSFGDLTVLSFGRDKVISSVFGGALLTSKTALAKKVKLQHHSLGYPSKGWVFKQLLHPVLMSLIVPTYFSFGKYLLFIYQKSHLLTWPVSKKEKSCQASLPIKKLAPALATLALHQLKKLNQTNHRRQQLAKLYSQNINSFAFKPNAIYLRYPVLVNQPEKIIKVFKQNRILLGNWYRPVIAPQGVDLAKAGYKKGSCPHAESFSQRIINLPTHPKLDLKDAQRIIQIFKTNVNL